jgi:hypothetical protein
MSNNRDKKALNILKNKIRIHRSTLTLDRSPETYENVVNRLVGEDAGDLLLEEGRGDGVGGWERTNQ